LIILCAAILEWESLYVHGTTLVFHFSSATEVIHDLKILLINIRAIKPRPDRFSSVLLLECEHDFSYFIVIQFPEDVGYSLSVTNSGSLGRNWAGKATVFDPMTGGPKDENLKLKKEGSRAGNSLI
jgi:hypothetical protein